MMFRKRKPGVIVLEPAFAARPGDVVVVRAREPLPHRYLERIGDELADLSRKTGVRFVVLDDNLSAEKREPKA